MSKVIFIVVVISSFGSVVQSENIRSKYYQGYAPRDHPILEWWETAVFYQIYPRSFKDSNDDGIGDLKGITSKLQYLKDLGVGATWLSPIFASPMADFGYDISDFRAINPDYGTLADFEAMLQEAKRLDIQIILDFVPNHSSDKHEWFQKSVRREDQFTNYYVWHSGTPNGAERPLPPNNWVSVFRDSAWTWNEQRGQYYLHQFLPQQPDLNYRDAALVQEMKDVLLFWLDKGVGGFRVDATNHMFEAELFPNEPESGFTDDPNDYNYLLHHYTKDLPETYAMLYSWRKILDNYKATNGGDRRVLLTEAYGNITFTMKYYESDDKSQLGSQMPFNFLLITDLNENSTAHDFVHTINEWLDYMPIGHIPNWVLGNHDNSRMGTRYGPKRIDALNILLMTLPGVAVTYNGEEIGMVDHPHISWEETQDPPALKTNSSVYQLYSRDPCRTPFQWNTDMNAGFSTSLKTWLPVNPNFKETNVAKEMDDLNSHYGVYRRLVKLRKKHTLMYGDLIIKALDHNVFALVRSLSAHDSFISVINLGGTESVVDLRIFNVVRDKLKVELVTSSSKLTEGSSIPSHNITLSAYDAIILSARPRSRNSATSLMISYIVLTTTIIMIYLLQML